MSLILVVFILRFIGKLHFPQSEVIMLKAFLSISLEQSSHSECLSLLASVHFENKINLAGINFSSSRKILNLAGINIGGSQGIFGGN